jgi:molybdopterin molybdotransferase
MTGAPLPAGADAVVPVELTDGGTARVAIREAVTAGDSVRRAGDAAAPGDALLASGIRLGPAPLGLLAATGRASVLARPRPRVTVLSTGNELAAPGTPLTRGRIWESNSFMLASAARRAGAVAYRQPSVPDEASHVLAVIEDAAGRADLLVTSGGVSMGGEHDVVKAALEQLGTVRFRKVAMQPGMPQGFGTLALPDSAAPEGKARGGLLSRLADRGEVREAQIRPDEHDRVPIFTLPGNPVSAYVSFQIFIRPALGALQDYDGLGLQTLRAEVTGPLRSPPGRRSYLRGVLDGGTAKITPLTGQGSHQVATLGKANALIIVPEWVVQMAAGETADVLVLP